MAAPGLEATDCALTILLLSGTITASASPWHNSVRHCVV